MTTYFVIMGYEIHAAMTRSSALLPEGFSVIRTVMSIPGVDTGLNASLLVEVEDKSAPDSLLNCLVAPSFNRVLDDRPDAPYQHRVNITRRERLRTVDVPYANPGAFRFPCERHHRHHCPATYYARCRDTGRNAQCVRKQEHMEWVWIQELPRLPDIPAFDETRARQATA